MVDKTKVELYEQTLAERLRIAEKTRASSINLMTSEVEVVHEIINDYLKGVKNETD